MDTADIHAMILKVKEHGLEKRFVLFSSLHKRIYSRPTTLHWKLNGTLMKILQSRGIGMKPNPSGNKDGVYLGEVCKIYVWVQECNTGV